MNLLGRLKKLETIVYSDEIEIFIMRWAEEVPMTKASWGNTVVFKNDDETQEEFEARAMAEVKKQPKTGCVKAIYLWLLDAAYYANNTIERI